MTWGEGMTWGESFFGNASASGVKVNIIVKQE
jgi:hypothetical protein